MQHLAKSSVMWLKEKMVHWNLLEFRLVFLSVAYLHLLLTAVVTLSIDLTVDTDPEVRAYAHNRWKLSTFWFNVLTLVYFPTRLYCDWKEKLGEGGSRLTKKLKHASDILMSSIIFPTTLYCDFLFWALFLTVPEAIASSTVFDYLPYWSQHSLHTVSCLVVVGDLLVTPRKKPRSLTPRLAILTSYLILYCAVVYISLRQGKYVYSCLETSSVNLLGIAVATYVGHLLLFALQWVAVEFVWLGSKKVK